MKSATAKPYGSWASPLTAESLTHATVGLGNIQFHGKDLYWTESRPEENGRTALVRWRRETGMETVLPEPWNVRTRVHEYGGLSFVVDEDGICFSQFDSQRLIRLPHGGVPAPVTSDNGHRYAAPVSDPRREGWFAVREIHSEQMPEPSNDLVFVHANGRVTSIVEGADFYADPVLSHDGEELAWIEWDHPFMAWDQARLMVGDLDEEGYVISARMVAGGQSISPFQPQWSADGKLYFVSDPKGWWNLMCWDGEGVTPVIDAPLEMGLPLWVFGMSTFALLDEGVAAVTGCENGIWKLGTVLLESQEITWHDLPFTEFHQVRASGNHIAVLAGGPLQPTSLLLLDGEEGTWEIIRESIALPVDPAYLSEGEPISFPTGDGAQSHGFYYAPRNPEFRGMPGEKPPLIVMSHGGPTAATSSALSTKVQFWTTRGYAVLDVNYRGSTGYGRPYREALLGQWGIHDVEDCVSGALELVKEGKADGTRMAIRGGSAGGYTTLAALTFRNAFHVGASYYGVSDIRALDAETHKFESRYTQRLLRGDESIAPPYEERSPLSHADQLACPVIFFQGLDDKIVPPNQSEEMAKALEAKGIPVAYVPFEGEGHGFRKAENIQFAYLSELEFYSRTFGIEIPDAHPAG